MKRLLFLIIFIFGYTHISLGQSEGSEWVVGVGASMVKFSDKSALIINERFNFQVPKINVTRYIFAGFSLDASLSFSTIKQIEGFFGNAFNYFSIDGAARYDFNQSYENVVPYLGIGVSLIGAPKKTIPGSITSPTGNFSAGVTFWFSPNYGVNFQGVYKYSIESIESMQSHTQFSLGIAYSFNSRPLRLRLWDKRH